MEDDEGCGMWHEHLIFEILVEAKRKLLEGYLVQGSLERGNKCLEEEKEVHKVCFEQEKDLGKRYLKRDKATTSQREPLQ